MARVQVADTSPYSHHQLIGNGKLGSAVVAVSDGHYKHPKTSVRNLIPDDIELLGLYHYLRSEVDISLQIDTLDSAIQPWMWDYLAVDFEAIHNSHLNGEFGRMCQRFMNEFKEAYGKPVLLYSRANIIQAWMAQFGQTWWQDEDLWIAQYPYNEKLYGPAPQMKEVPTVRAEDGSYKWNPRLPAGAKGWKMWQYSAGGNQRGSEFGADSGSSLDLDVFNGTMEEMKAWCSKEVVEPEPDCSEVRLQTINECQQALEEIK